MISTSQREHLTYTLIGQVIVTLLSVVVAWKYILPGIITINESIATTEQTIEKYKDAVDKWYSVSELTAILWGMPNSEELIKIIQATDQAQINTTLQKNGNGDYLTWLKNAINSSEDDKKKLAQAKKKINSILPTMSPMSARVDEENITLKWYISYMERVLIKGFNFDTNMALWIQSLAYGNAGNGVPSTIGTFDLRLDFKARNSDIIRFIDYVNASWEPDILTNTGLLSEDSIPEIMSNPLMTMESFALQSPLDARDGEKQNSGRATVRLYLRGASKDEITYLRDNLQVRKDELQINTTAAIKRCKESTTLCTQIADLEAFQKKYNEFIRGVSDVKKWGIWIEDIYNITQQVNSLRSLETEFESFSSPLSR